ncbi:MAG: EamA family transporter [Candidatus Nanopelagicales bacterium]
MSDFIEPLPGVTLTKNPHPYTGYFLYLIASVLFALNGTVSKAILMTGIDTERLSQLRVTVAFLVLLTFVAIKRPNALRLKRKEIPVLIAYGILGVAMTQYLYFVALVYLPVGVALLIEFTAPVMVALWMRLVWKEPTRKTVWLALGMAIAGLALVAQIWNGFALNAVGVIAALLAAVSLTIFYILGDKQMRVENHRDPVSLVMWGFAAAALFWAIVQPWWSFPWDLLSGDSEPLGSAEFIFPIWSLSIYLVLLGTVIPFWLTVESLKHLRASQASTVGLTEPLFATIIAWILLGESLTLVQLSGGALILVGVFVAEHSRNRTRAVLIATS